MKGFRPSHSSRVWPNGEFPRERCAEFRPLSVETAGESLSGPTILPQTAGGPPFCPGSAFLVLETTPRLRSVGGRGRAEFEKDGLTSREDRTERFKGERDLTVADGETSMRAPASGSDALMWLELAVGPIREVLVERLAQAHMVDLAPEVATGESGWQGTFEES